MAAPNEQALPLGAGRSNWEAEVNRADSTAGKRRVILVRALQNLQKAVGRFEA